MCLIIASPKGKLADKQTLLDGFNRDGGIARVSGDRRWLYMLDSRDEGDLWMASRDRGTPLAAEPGRDVTTGAPR